MKIKTRSKQRLADNLRFQSLVILDQILNQEGYSNVLVNEFLKSSSLSEVDNRLFVQIVYGVVQRDMTLEYMLQPYIKDKKLDPWIIILLKVSLFQMIFLDRIPNHAIVNEAVEIAKINGHHGLGKFVNAILREVIRDELSFETLLSNIQSLPILEQLSLKYSMPIEMLQTFQDQLSHDDMVAFLESTIKIPHVSVRINSKLCQRNEAIQLLEAQNYDVKPSDLSPDGIVITSGNILKSKAYKLGLITVQDESSMLVAPLGKLNGTENVLDACAAPGGKATHTAAYLTQGHLTALDIYDHKLSKVKEHLERMKLSEPVTLIKQDATEFVPEDKQLFDRIYLDAPCSGLGLIRRKPEIKYRKKATDIVSLIQVQNQLLDHLITLLKSGGILIYSTCTLTQGENEHLLNDFCQRNENISVSPISEQELLNSEILTDEGFVRVWPHQFDTDGFFIGRLIKH